MASAQTPAWEQTSGPPSGAISALYVSRSNVLYANTLDGLYQSVDHKTWNHPAFQLDTCKIVWPIAETLGGTLLAGFKRGSTGGIARSTDGGLHWDSATGCPFQISGLNAQSSPYYAWINGGIWQSTDDGTSWKEITPFAQPSNGGGMTSAVLRTSQGSLLAALAGYNYATYDHGVPDAHWQQGGLFRSSDSGGTWTKVASGELHTLFEHNGHLFADGYSSDDDGMTWQQMSKVPFMNPVTMNPAGALFGIGDSAKLYRSDDLGKSWSLTGARFGLRDPYHCLVSDSIGVLFAGLDSGAWRLVIATGGVASDPHNSTPDLDCEIFVQGRSPQLLLTLEKIGVVHIALYDTHGTRIMDLGDRTMGAGTHTIPLPRNLSSGAYFIEATSENTAVVRGFAIK